MRMTLVRPTSFNGLSTVVPHEESVSRSSSTITLGPFSTPPPSPCHISESSSISSFADHFLPHFSTEDKDWSAFAYLLDTVELPDVQTEDEEEEGGLRLEIHEPSLPPTSPSGSTATHASPSPTVSPSPPYFIFVQGKTFEFAVAKYKFKILRVLFTKRGDFIQLRQFVPINIFLIVLPF